MEKKLRFGVFGLARGISLSKELVSAGAEVVAVCERRPAAVATFRQALPEFADVAAYEDFDSFIRHDMDAVLLCNYFCEHAGYAVKAMRAGKHVLSETLPNVTMAEGVELCRVKEETGMTYALFENYPFLVNNLEMKKIYGSGTLGNLVYAEGSYIHPVFAGEQNILSPGERHWRNWTPRTYYSTHGLCPLMMITGAEPVRVSSMASFHPEVSKGTALRYGDTAAVIMCQTDTDAVFRVVSCGGYAAYGNRYNICCTKGSVVTIPFCPNIALTYNSWDAPEELKCDGEYLKIYEPSLAAFCDKEELEKIFASGHGGADYLAIRDFVRALQNGDEPFFDVYRATRAASTAILAWRSVLNGGAAYDVPDFRKEEDRKLWENDDLSPFPDENMNAGLPCSSKPYAPSEEDLAAARRDWENVDFVLN